MTKKYYYNYNGEISDSDQNVTSIYNRSFRYGDGLFESMRWEKNDIPLLTYHLDRLRKGIRLLKMDGEQVLDPVFIRKQIAHLVKKNNISETARIRLNVFREGGGFYAPTSNKAAFLIEAEALDIVSSMSTNGIIIDVFNEHKKSINEFSQLKSNNALLSVMAGIYRQGRGFDEVLLLNENGFLCEGSASNIFIWYQNTLYTPALSEGCVDGVMRRVVIEVAMKNDINVMEAQIDPEILNEAEELFVTNAVQGIRWVLGYKRKRFFNNLSKGLQSKVEKWKSEKLNIK